MYNSIKKILLSEISLYQKLSKDLQKLTISYYLYAMAYTLFFIFTNAYLWRNGQNLYSLFIYNFLYCIGLPLGFYLNGLLLRKIQTAPLYWLGCLLEGIMAVCIVVFPSINSNVLAIYGFFAGIGSGIFWANKNYIELILSKGDSRVYYVGLVSAGEMIINIFTPFLAGSFIAFASIYGLETLNLSYKALMLVGLVLVAVSGYILQGINVQGNGHEELIVQKPTKKWKMVRIYNILSNIAAGAEFVIPSVLVLVLVGKEGTLGLVNSSTALFSAICVYLVGRKGASREVWKMASLGRILSIFGGLILALYFGPAAVLLYIGAFTIAYALYGPLSYPVVMGIMDEEDKGKSKYAFICDSELSYNFGRCLGLALIPIVALLDQTAALRFIPLIVGLISIFSIVPFRYLNKFVHVK